MIYIIPRPLKGLHRTTTLMFPPPDAMLDARNYFAFRVVGGTLRRVASTAQVISTVMRLGRGAS
jgi:hypothetical protein